MEKTSTATRLLSAALFLFGLVLALALAIASFWPDLEASLFDPALSAEEPFRGLRCPLVITEGEATEIEATFDNPFDREIRFLVQMHISQGFVSLIREERTVVELPAGESEILQWPVTADDAAFGRLILARLYAFRNNPMPSRDQTCGILVLGVPGLTGDQLVGTALVVSLLSMGVGGAWWLRNEATLSTRVRAIGRATAGLAVLALVSLVAGIAGLWTISLFALVIGVLVFAAMVERFG